MPIRFQSDRQARQAIIRNLSETGLFIATDEPLAPGTSLSLRLELDACSLPLRGFVVWNRNGASPGTPGMGVNLIRPPALYRDYVKRL